MPAALVSKGVEAPSLCEAVTEADAVPVERVVSTVPLRQILLTAGAWGSVVVGQR